MGGITCCNHLEQLFQFFTSSEQGTFVAPDHRLLACGRQNTVGDDRLFAPLDVDLLGRPKLHATDDQARRRIGTKNGPWWRGGLHPLRHTNRMADHGVTIWATPDFAGDDLP